MFACILHNYYINAIILYKYDFQRGIFELSIPASTDVARIQYHFIENFMCNLFVPGILHICHCSIE